MKDVIRGVAKVSVNRRHLWASLALALSPLVAGVSQAAQVQAVATFTVLADVVEEIGGERVEVQSLVGPNGDPHVFEPTPSDVRALRGADVVFMSGLGLEGWMDRLIASSGYEGDSVIVSEGVALRDMDGPAHGHEDGGHDDGDHAHSHEDEGHGHEDEGHGHDDHGHGHENDVHAHDEGDPHVWQSPANVQVWVDNVVAALSRIDPEGADTYRANGEAYRETLGALDQWARDEIEQVPEEQRRVLTSHDAFGYFGERYGVTFLSPQGITTASEPSAGDVARIIEQIREREIGTYFLESGSSPRLIEQIAGATGARPGGTLYVGALSDPDGPAADYPAMFRHNVERMVEAMQDTP